MTEIKDENGHQGQAEVISEVEKKIIKQIEFYFGDKNFPRDNFLRQKAEEDDGWVALDCLTTFNRLKVLSSDCDVIVKALNKSDAGIVEVSEDSKKVRRVKSKPLPENTFEARQTAKTKTAYCKGFPKETTLDQLEEYFAVKGKVIYILMRRTEEKAFKGSVFVEFETVEAFTAFMALESDKVKFNEEEITRMTKEEYYKSKNDERHQRKEEEKIEKEKKAVKQEKKEEEIPKHEKGCVVHFKGAGEQTSREDLKTLFGEHEEIAWVDFSRGEDEGYVRFSNEGVAQKVVDALLKTGDGKLLIRDVETTLRVLEGQEETDYWKRVQEERKKAKQRKAGRQGGGRGGGRGGRGGGRGRFDRKRHQRSDRSTDRSDSKETGGEGAGQESKGSHVRFEDGEPSAKKAKTEVKTED